ncbi:MAG: RHS repeat-associated core domain-containing protein, partial [Candidatus Magasanikbacteria bacterium]
MKYIWILFVMTFSVLFPIQSVFAVDEVIPIETDIIEEILPTTEEEVIGEIPVVTEEVSEPLVADSGEASLEMNAMSGSGEEGLPYDPTKDAVLSKFAVKADEASGALTYDYPLDIPQGRNGLQPSISFQYNSQNTSNENILGYGWTLSVPFIERVNKMGIDKLYTENYFTSSLSGEMVTSTLSDEMHGTYVPRVQSGENVVYEFHEDGFWTMKTKEEMVYTFGQTNVSRQDNGDHTKIYKWMVDKIEDPNGNSIDFTYIKETGQIYPSNITYTNANGINGIYTIQFAYENRADDLKMYNKGFEVFTQKRLNTIEVLVNGQWKKRYTLSYTAGDNGLRSMLNNVIASYFDGTSDENTIFNYSNHAPEWTVSSYYGIGDFINSQGNTYYDTGKRIMDINGDSLNDAIKSVYQQIEGSIYQVEATWEINTGNGYTEEWLTTIPVGIIKELSDHGVRIFDINGDNYLDFVQSYSGEQNIYLHNGDSVNPDWNLVEMDIPVTFAQYSPYTNPHVQTLKNYVMDANSDGLADIIHPDSFNPNNGFVYVNRLDHWENDVFTNLDTLNTNINQDRRRNFDINGDGIQDQIFAEYDRYLTPKSSVYIGDGYRGWTEVLSLENTLPESFNLGQYDYGTRWGDVNGDGLTDLIRNQPELNVNAIHLNTGKGWTTLPSGLLPVSTIGNYYVPVDNGVRVEDMNGDGMIDFTGSYALVDNQYTARDFVSTGIPADLLTTVTNSTATEISITYKPSTQYTNVTGNLLNPNLPTIIQTVDTIDINDGLENISTDTYEYSGGKMWYNNAYDKKFAGFAIVKKTDVEGNVSKTYFHQGEDSYSKIGYPYKTEVLDNQGNIYQVEETTYTVQENNKSYQITPDSVVRKTYDGNETHKDSAESFVYDTTNGNLLTHIQYGEVLSNEDGTFGDIGEDKVTSSYTYATPTVNANMTGHIASEVQENYFGTKVKETKYFYDNLPSGQVEKGNQTRNESWITGNSYAIETKTYTNQGLVATETDANGNVTTYMYDTYTLYPATVRNAKDQVTWYTYNYINGKPISILDPNGNTYEYTYDGKGRILAEKIPNPDGSVGTVTKTSYTYTDNVIPRIVKKTDYLDVNNFVDTYTYINGFDQPLQERKEGVNTYLVKDYTYNRKRQLETESLPYESAGSSKTSGTQNQNILTSYTYDALGRKKTITNVLGTSIYIYDDWKTTLIDPLNNTKDLYYDAFERIIGVDEHESGNTFETRYEYNANNNLTKITDAYNNVRNFIYDGVERRIQAEDLHAVGDTSFGVYNYTYDANGNVIEEHTPNGDVIYSVYDVLNRPLTEAVNDITDIQAEYIYDNCTNGKTKLCATLTPEVYTQYAYDNNGNITEEARTVDMVEYEVKATTSYDRQGNIQSISYPDNTVVSYVYNNAGLLNSVLRENTSIISNIEYNPMQMVESIVYGNGITTVNTYDTNELYRLRNKITTNNVNNFQDITYTYDQIGNIAQIVDTSDTNASKTSTFTYDDLYRLTSATITNSANNQNYIQTYAYDAIGNITNKSDQGNYLYQGTNPHAVSSINGQVISYDNNGNTVNNGEITLTWDYNNRLVQTENIQDQNQTVYGYDHDGQRIYKSSVNGTTIYPNKYLELRDGNVVQYVYAGNSAVATIEDNEIYYNHTDHLSGSNVVTNQNGTVNQILDYYPFGGERINEQTTDHDETKKYTGYEMDDETSMYYANARYYNANIGRFVSVDPVPLNQPEQLIQDPQALNMYAYSRNNPLRYVDPDGKFYIPNYLKQWGGQAKQSISSSINSAFVTTDKVFDRLGWYNSSVLGQMIGLDESARLLRHSLQDNPSKIILNDDSSIIKEIKGSKNYQQYIDDLISANKGKTEIKFDSNQGSNELIFDRSAPDLYLGLHSLRG